MKANNQYMQMALKMAQDGYKKGEIPVGAIIIDNDTGEIIASATNKVEELSDPLAHAEMLAIKLATKKQKSKWLENCSLYVTLEPCPMCAQAISLARLKAVYYGALDKKSGGVDSGPMVLNSKSAHHKPDVYSGIMESECAAILKKFFVEKRKK